MLFFVMYSKAVDRRVDKGETMFTRWICIVLMFVALLLGAAIGANADNEHNVICGDLAESDCQILQENRTAMDSVSSFMFSMAMTMDLAHESSLEGDFAMNLSIDGDGGISINPEAMAGILELEDQIENSPGLSLSEDEIAQLDSFLAGLSGEIRADIHLVADGETTDFALHMLMHDGVFALDADAVEELMEQPMDGMDWIGLDAKGLLPLLASDPGMSELLGLDADEELPEGASTLADVEEAATTITRLADSEVNGLAVAVFESSVEMSLLADMVIGAYEGTTALDPSEIAAMRQQLADAALNMRQYIGLSDHYTYRTELSMEMGSADVQAGGLGASEMSLSMTLDQSNFNEPVTASIPEDAFILPLAMLMQMGN